MSRVLHGLMSLGLLALAPALAQAGWVIDWSTTAVTQKDERMPTQQSIQYISDNRVRMQQPEITSITDFTQDRFTLINSTKRYFWSGSVDDYVREMTAQRTEALADRTGKLPIPQIKKDEAKKAEAEHKKPSPSPTVLPPVSLTSAGAGGKVAGYDTDKYEVRVDGDLFQEVWLAPSLKLGSDLDLARFIAQQQKTGAAMIGKSAKQYNAMYNDAEYRDLLTKGFVLKTTTHHMAGSFERVATSVKQTDVAASEFTPPDDYRKVRLADLFDPPPTPAPRSTTPPVPRPPTKLKKP
jgi:hypothetical protein